LVEVDAEGLRPSRPDPLTLQPPERPRDVRGAALPRHHPQKRRRKVVAHGGVHQLDLDPAVLLRKSLGAGQAAHATADYHHLHDCTS
jgi:hypothetical protein